ncbi:MAG: Si-specific NAD(P)(+) transhydrogenase [Chitinophagaceae bacterium]|nr:Si-specific NAD(P)(+) transhydrogenase [Oligoflexus sp.]
MSESTFDLVVIGSGPAGIQAVLHAAKLGKKVALIEKHPEKLGGAWIHTGTLPSKTMREVLAAIRSVESHVGEAWVTRMVQNLSTKALRERAALASRDEEYIIRRQLDEYRIPIIRGAAYIENPKQVRVNQAGGKSLLLDTQFIMIATGSRPRRPANIPFDGWRVLDSDDVLRLESLPKSMTIWGAGVIACEYACIFQALGVETTIIDSRSHIMQFMDQEIANELKKAMEQLGVTFHLGHELERVEVNGARVQTYFKGLTCDTDVFFFAAGRESCSEQMGLDKLGIPTNDRKTILVNSVFQTAVPNIYAAGDVIGPPALASTSAEQGRIAVCHAFGDTKVRFPEYYPLGVYTIPEMSSVGLTEEELMKTNYSYVVGRARYDQIARGYIRGDSYGLIKILICADSQKILGLHIVGHDAANLVHIGQVAMITKMTIYEFAENVIFNFPTLAEGYKIAAFDAIAALEKRVCFLNDKKAVNN